MKVQRFDHTAIAVHDMREATDLFCGVWARSCPRRRRPILDIRTSSSSSPRVPRSSWCSRWATTPVSGIPGEGGQGLHHITFFVDDVVEAERSRFRRPATRRVDTHLDDPGWRETYIRPSRASARSSSWLTPTRRAGPRRPPTTRWRTCSRAGSCGPTRPRPTNGTTCDHGPWAEGTTVGDMVLRTAEQWGDRTAVAFPEPGERRTYAELAGAAVRTARSLWAAGIRKGDHVGILMPNCIDYVEVFAGAALSARWRSRSTPATGPRARLRRRERRPRRVRHQ